MVRSRTLTRVVPAALLTSACTMAVPLAAQGAPGGAARSVEAARPQRPVLAVPRALLHAPAVPVIVQLTTPVPQAGAGARVLLDRSPALHSLLAGVRTHLLDALRADHARDVYAYHLIPAVAATVPGNALARLLRQPGVRSIVLDQQHILPRIPEAAGRGTMAGGPPPGVATGGRLTINAPQTVEPQSLALTRADVAQTHGFTGAGVRVAVVDSGLDTSVPDLANLLATDAQGRPLRVDFTGTGLQDTVGHGTACTSMIASQGHTLYSGSNRTLLQVYPQPSASSTVYNSHFHVYGMAPGVKILSAKIFDARAPHGGGYDSWIVRAIEWAVDNHADVISESFGGLSVPSNGTDPTAEADEAAVRAGVTVLAADGNEGPGQTTISSPANAPGVIAVGASTEYRSFAQTGFLAPYGPTVADNVASFTSRGPTTDGRPRPDLVAPGAFTWALFPQARSDDGPDKPPYTVGTFGGTSQATPVTAGAAALVIAAYEKVNGGARPTPALVRSILMSSAHDLGYPAFDQGAGRIDAWEAVQTVMRSAPSFLLNPNSAAVAGPAGSPFSTAFTLTNTGYTPRHYTLDAVVSQRIGVRTWDGSLSGTVLRPYKINVIPGLERIVGMVYWNSADRFVVKNGTQEVAMRVALYDPLGRFVNYSYGVGSGYASAQAVHPMPGVWTVVISENGRKDNVGVRHYTFERYRARLDSFVSAPFGTVTPGAVTLAPGHTARLTLSGQTPSAAGQQVVTVHVRGDHTAAFPVAITSDIALNGNNAAFTGALNGASNGYFSLDNENKVYSLTVPDHTRSLDVALTWPDQGYGVILLLVDPSGEIVDAQFNGIGNGSSGGVISPFDLSSRTLEALWSNPHAGRWQIVVMDAVFSGQRSQSEPFKGRVTLNDTPVTPLALTHAALPGESFALDLNVRNDNGPNAAEGYIGYATTDKYSEIPLGTIRSPFGPVNGVSGGSIYTYTTGFVPPATRMVVSSFAAVHPAVPIDLAFADPIGFARAQGQPAPVTVDGHTYQGVSAVVAGPALPIGPWFGEITLRRPADAGTSGGLVGTSYAYALTPLSWVTFDHGLQNGQITGGQPLILLPGQKDQLHASVTVPLSTPPGVYHARLFVYTIFGDQAASIPLTIVVQAHTGTEPAVQSPQG